MQDTREMQDEMNHQAAGATAGAPHARKSDHALRASEEARVFPQPFFFGDADRPLMGCLHRPAEWNGTRVLLCPPLGFEGLLSHLTMNETAAQIAARAGAVAMRIDYDGSGDSSGADEDPDRIPAWMKTIDQAIDYLKGISSDHAGPIILVGLRGGALLAAHVAARRSDVTALALWAPCPTGKSFLREQRAFSQLTLANPKGGTDDVKGLESNGFFFNEEAVTALEALSLKTLTKPPAPHILVVQRAELNIANVLPKACTEDKAACDFEEQTTSDYQTMMEPPWLWQAPIQAATILSDWISRVSAKVNATPRSASPMTPVTEEKRTATVAPGVEETTLTFGKNHQCFGILTEPSGTESKKTKHAVLLVTSTFGYRIGPNRVNVRLARHFAKQGISTLRIDVRGVGDSRIAIGSSPPRPYDMNAVDDVTDAVDLLKARGYQKLTLSGVCAGAFLVWSAAERMTTTPVQLALVNLETFDFVDYNRELMTKFENPPPGFKTALKAAKTLPEKARVVVPKLLSWSKLAGNTLHASSPAWLMRKTLGARIRRVLKNGSRVDLVFSSGDAGLRQYYLRTTVHHWAMKRRGLVSVEVIDGPDHSFTPRWAAALLTDALSSTLKTWSSSS